MTQYKAEIFFNSSTADPCICQSCNSAIISCDENDNTGHPCLVACGGAPYMSYACYHYTCFMTDDSIKEMSASGELDVSRIVSPTLKIRKQITKAL